MAPLIFPNVVFRCVPERLLDYSDVRVARMFQNFIAEAKGIEPKYVSPLKVEKNPRLDIHGEVEKRRFNLVLKGITLPYKEILDLFLANEAMRIFGFPMKVDFNLRNTGTRCNKGDILDKLEMGFGVSSKDCIPVRLNLGGEIFKITGHRVFTTKDVANRVENFQFSGYKCFVVCTDSEKTALKINRGDETIVTMMFLSKIEACNFAYKKMNGIPVSGLGLYKKSEEDVIQLTELTAAGKSSLSPSRYKTICNYCNKEISLESIDKDLFFFHGKCNCPVNSYELWPGETMIRYTLNPCIPERFGKSVDHEPINLREPSGSALVKMIMPFSLIHSSPQHVSKTVLPTIKAEHDYNKKKTKETHTCDAKVEMVESLTSLCEKFTEMGLVISVKRSSYWKEKNVEHIMALRLYKLNPNEKINTDNNDKNVVGKAKIEASCIEVYQSNGHDASAETTRDRLYLQVAAKMRKGEVVVVGDMLECQPIPSDYHLKNINRTMKAWSEWNEKEQSQTLVACAQLDSIIGGGGEEEDGTTTIKIALVTLKLKDEEASKITGWNPDLTCSYIGCKLLVSGYYKRDEMPGESLLPLLGRVVNVSSVNADDGQPSCRTLQAQVRLDFEWNSELELYPDKLHEICFKLWIEEKKELLIQNGLPAGAELENEAVGNPEEDFFNGEGVDFGALDEELMDINYHDTDNDPEPVPLYALRTRNVPAMGLLYRDIRETLNKPDWKDTIPIYQDKHFQIKPISNNLSDIEEYIRDKPASQDFSMLDYLLNCNNLKHSAIPIYVPKHNYQEKVDMCKIVEMLFSLNDNQAETWRKLKNCRVSIVVGPPGCGKTRVAAILAIIMKMLEKGPCIILCPSNAACDVMYRAITAALKEFKTKAETIRMIALKKEDEYNSAPDIKWLHDLVAERVHTWDPKGQAIFKAYKTRGRAMLSRDQRRQLNIYVYRESYKILRNMEIIVSTVGAANDGRLRSFVEKMSREDMKPPAFFIDEASKLTVADLIPLASLEPQRLCFLGDPSQLFPVVISPEASRACLDFSWIRMAPVLPQYDLIATQLTDCYRMHGDICELASLAVYNKSLVPADTVTKRNQSLEVMDLYARINFNFPELEAKHVAWYTYDDSHKDEELNHGNYVNYKEADIIVSLVAKLYLQCGVSPENILVISMYMAQVYVIKSKLLEKGVRFAAVRVATVDASQGSENDVVIQSFVRNNDDQHIGFLQHIERINVASTRPRHYLFWVGNCTFLSQIKHYAIQTFVSAFRNLRYPIIMYDSGKFPQNF